jgi:hypothetical protein
LYHGVWVIVAAAGVRTFFHLRIRRDGATYDSIKIKWSDIFY